MPSHYFQEFASLPATSALPPNDLAEAASKHLVERNATGYNIKGGVVKKNGVGSYRRFSVFFVSMVRKMGVSSRPFVV